MKILTTLSIVAALAAVSPLAARAQDGIDPAKAAAFDSRMFAGPVGNQSSACFVRRYDADHLAHHPKQKVAAMKLLLTAEKPPGEEINHVFHLGVQYRDRPGNFDAGDHCDHTLVENSGHEIRFSCGGGCEGGGIQIALSKDNKSTIVRVDSIAVLNRKNPAEDGEMLRGGTDDKVFRLDRADNKECAELLGDHEKMAELRSHD